MLIFLLPIGLFLFRTISGPGEAAAVADTGGAGTAAAAPDTTALGALFRVLSSPATWRTVGFTFAQAAASAAAGVLLAVPGAWIISHFDFPLRGLLRSLSLLPFILPSIVVVLAMISFFGRNGLLASLFDVRSSLIYSVPGIVLAHVFYDFSLAMRIIADRWSQIDPRLEEAAASLGDSRRRTFFRVTLPLLTPAIVAGFVLVFIYSFLSFGIVLVFGGLSNATIEVQIYREMFVNFDEAAAGGLTLLQLVLTGVLFAFAGRWMGRAVISPGAQLRPLVLLRRARPASRVLVASIAGVLLVFVAGPIVTMAVRALTDSGTVSLEPLLALFSGARGTLRSAASIVQSSIPLVILRSLGLALAAGALSFTFALVIALSLHGKRAHFFDTAFLVPLGLSIVTVALSLHDAYDGILHPALVVVLAQFFVALPTTYRIMRTSVEGLDRSYIESAQALGAGRAVAFVTVTAPMLRYGFANAFAYALALPFADFTAVMTAGAGEITTFPVAIYRLMGFRSFDQGIVLGLVYILMCLVIFSFLDRSSRPRVRLAGATDGEPAPVEAKR